ncbi:MAG: hypothetical protein ACYTX0_49940, partial [Nostoc sp.]
METLLYETLRERQAQGIALRVACFHEVVRQSSGQRVTQYPTLGDATRSFHEVVRQAQGRQSQ